MSTDAYIYHLTPASAFRDGLSLRSYVPATFHDEGFVHCTSGESLCVRVADDYFADCEEPLLVLRIDPQQLKSEIRYEAPAPHPGAGRSHLEAGDTFPHVYGPIEFDAIVGVGVLDRRDGGFVWPRHFGPLPASVRAQG